MSKKNSKKREQTLEKGASLGAPLLHEHFKNLVLKQNFFDYKNKNNWVLDGESRAMLDISFRNEDSSRNEIKELQKEDDWIFDNVPDSESEFHRADKFFMKLHYLQENGWKRRGYFNSLDFYGEWEGVKYQGKENKILFARLDSQYKKKAGSIPQGPYSGQEDHFSGYLKFIDCRSPMEKREEEKS